LYSLYLNDLLIAENLDDFEYELKNLNSEESYNVKVIAINEFGENESLLNFTTTENNDPPGDFDVSIDYVTQNSATIYWTEASANNSSEILYSLYLNDLLYQFSIQMSHKISFFFTY
jgi:hypothetical protein